MTLRTRTVTTAGERLRAQTGDLLVLTVLLLLAGATHGPVFGDRSGYVAAAGGVLLGVLVSVPAARWRWNLLETSLATVLVYLLGGGALALPSTTTSRVVPTLATIQGLVVGAVRSWKDLLTLTPPAGAFAGPAIVPFLSSLVCSVLALTITLRGSRPGWALLPVTVLGVVGAAWGSQNAPLSSWLGTAAAVLAVLWGSWLERRRRQASAAGIVVSARAVAGLQHPARVLGGLLALALAAGAGGAAPRYLDPEAHRAVLRDQLEPPLDLSSYASPLTSYRYWMDDKKDAVLFTVDGLRKDQRVRLATLDAYDGVVMRVGDARSGAGFRRVGTTVSDTPLPPEAQTTTLSITINDYNGYWIPGGGELRRLEVTSRGAQEVQATVYYSSHLQAAMTTRGLTKGDTYQVETVLPAQWSDAELSGRSFGQVPMPADQQVPEEVGQRMPEFLGETQDGVEAVRALTRSFSTLGFYSDGSDSLSLASHSAARLARFLDPARLMVGDDEQYAVAMALMARQAGFPARVVLGFYPASYTGGTQEITGTDAHAWVEVFFSGAGWVAFDPTPPRDKKPQTELPEPKPNPRPQVIQPPVPPQDPADLNPDVDEDDQDDQDDPSAWWPWVLVALKVLGGLLLLLAPFMTIVLVKALRRRRRRRAREPLAQVTGAWDELVDQARDLRMQVPLAVPRCEQVEAIRGGGGQPARSGFRPLAEAGSLEALAQDVDGAVFSGAPVLPAVAERSWSSLDRVLLGLRQQSTRRRRLQAAVSLASLRPRARGRLAKAARLRAVQVAPKEPGAGRISNTAARSGGAHGSRQGGRR